MSPKICDPFTDDRVFLTKRPGAFPDFIKTFFIGMRPTEFSFVSITNPLFGLPEVLLKPSPKINV